MVNAARGQQSDAAGRGGQNIHPFLALCSETAISGSFFGGTYPSHGTLRDFHFLLPPPPRPPPRPPPAPGPGLPSPVLSPDWIHPHLGVAQGRQVQRGRLGARVVALPRRGLRPSSRSCRGAPTTVLACSSTMSSRSATTCRRVKWRVKPPLFSDKRRSVASRP